MASKAKILVAFTTIVVGLGGVPQVIEPVRVSGAVAGAVPSVLRSQRKKTPKIKRSKAGRRASARRRSRGRLASRTRTRRPVARSNSGPAAQRSIGGGIPAERVVEIQNALVRGGYLEVVSGQYDESTVDAMKRFQVKNGLPATGLPSAHSLKLLRVSKSGDQSYAVPIKRLSDNGLGSSTEHRKQ